MAIKCYWPSALMESFLIWESIFVTFFKIFHQKTSMRVEILFFRIFLNNFYFIFGHKTSMKRPSIQPQYYKNRSFCDFESNICACRFKSHLMFFFVAWTDYRRPSVCLSLSWIFGVHQHWISSFFFSFFTICTLIAKISISYVHNCSFSWKIPSRWCECGGRFSCKERPFP